MKVLIVDDESRKLKIVSGIIKRINNGQSIEVYTSLDLADAKGKMQHQRFDMVILDLKINENLSDELENNDQEAAGLDFIQEILETNSIRTPIEIVILTEYEELQKKYSGSSEYSAYTFLYYDESSCEWSDIILHKINYHLKREESLIDFSEVIEADVAIICAVDNEMSVVKSLFFDDTKVRKTFENDSTNYYIVTKSIKNETRRIVIAQQNEMGMVAAASLTECIIHHFNPKYIIMVGIAAGISDDEKYGDIIVAIESWNYMSGKYCVENGETVFKPDPKKISIDVRLEQLLRREFDESLMQIRNEWRSVHKPDNNITLQLGSLACGVAVIGSNTIVADMITSHARKTKGLDMESYGVYYAARRSINTKAICLKGISDFADSRKNDKYQSYAAYTSTSFAKYLIENELEY